MPFVTMDFIRAEYLFKRPRQGAGAAPPRSATPTGTRFLKVTLGKIPGQCAKRLFGLILMACRAVARLRDITPARLRFPLWRGCLRFSL